MAIREYLRKLKYSICGRRKNWNFEHPVRLIKNVEVSRNVSIGRYTYIVSGRIYPDTKIGRFCSMAENVYVGAGNHPINWLMTSPFQYGGIFKIDNHYIKHEEAGPTEIGNDVWIGANVFIKRGIIVGDGAIIAAGALVVKDVPPYAIVGGNPAKLIKYRFDEQTIDVLLKLKWWDLDVDLLKNLPYNDINAAILQLKSKIMQTNRKQGC